MYFKIFLILFVTSFVSVRNYNLLSSDAFTFASYKDVRFVLREDHVSVETITASQQDFIKQSSRFSTCVQLIEQRGQLDSVYFEEAVYYFFDDRKVIQLNYTLSRNKERRLCLLSANQLKSSFIMDELYENSLFIPREDVQHLLHILWFASLKQRYGPVSLIDYKLKVTKVVEGNIFVTGEVKTQNGRLALLESITENDFFNSLLNFTTIAFAKY